MSLLKQDRSPESVVSDLQKIFAANEVEIVTELSVGSALHLRVEDARRQLRFSEVCVKETKKGMQIDQIAQVLAAAQMLATRDDRLKFSVAHSSLQTAFVKFIELQNRKQE